MNASKQIRRRNINWKTRNIVWKVSSAVVLIIWQTVDWDEQLEPKTGILSHAPPHPVIKQPPLLSFPTSSTKASCGQTVLFQLQTLPSSSISFSVISLVCHRFWFVFTPIQPAESSKWQKNKGALGTQLICLFLMHIARTNIWQVSGFSQRNEWYSWKLRLFWLVLVSKRSGSWATMEQTNFKDFSRNTNRISQNRREEKKGRGCFSTSRHYLVTRTTHSI